MEMSAFSLRWSTFGNIWILGRRMTETIERRKGLNFMVQSQMGRIGSNLSLSIFSEYTSEDRNYQILQKLNFHFDCYSILESYAKRLRLTIKGSGSNKDTRRRLVRPPDNLTKGRPSQMKIPVLYDKPLNLGTVSVAYKHYNIHQSHDTSGPSFWATLRIRHNTITTIMVCQLPSGHAGQAGAERYIERWPRIL